MKKIKHVVLITVVSFLLGELKAQDFKNSFQFNFTPTAGYRILVDDSATGLLPAFRNYETARFGMAFNFQYTRILKKWIHLSIGLEYQYFEYGGTLPYYYYDSINNYTTAGRVKTSFIHHYIGIPIKFTFNLVSKEKFRLYTFLGVNPKFAISRQYASELTDTIHNSVSTYHQEDPEGTSNTFHHNIFNVEGLVGLGFNFNLSKRLYVDLHGMFGMNMLKSNRDTPINEYVYRVGGNVGLGYFF